MRIRCDWGVCLDGVPWDPSKLEAWIENVSGCRPAILHWWHTWDRAGGYRPFDRGPLDKCVAAGAVPLITWASEGSSPQGTQDPARWTLRSIMNGTHDAYIRQFAADAKAGEISSISAGATR